jgi:carbon monoxide dehydrogenase subunit G
MQVDFGGDEEFDAPIEEVRSFVMNIEEVASCIPDSSNFSRIDSNHFTMNIEPGLGVVKGSLPLHCSLESKAENNYTYSIEGKGLGSEVKMSLSLNLYEKGNSTGVKWESIINIKGIMGGIGEAVVRKITQEYVEKIIANARRKIAER